METQTVQILIVEDDEHIAKMIQVSLSLANYKGTICSDGNQVMDVLREGTYQLVLLDIMLPGKDGFRLMEEIRPLKIPVIFLTAKQDVMDKVNGLKMGAEDYIVKPFESMELLARIEVVLRRYQTAAPAVLSYGSLTVDVERHEAFKDGAGFALTPREFDVLVYFLQHPDVIIRKETLMAAVWGYDFMGETRTVDTHVQQVRKKAGLKDRLLTVPKIGYRLLKE